ncbi:hypothetical protein [Natronomonas amylolytica]|uniref:hypothetical protein n=1 Tax=Natronomonas amylolytica TaxID=3108498 RepID=UPI00300A545E
MIDAEGPHSRGQILIITALMLAVVFVGLALVLNSAIYTENLSTREVGSSTAPLSEDEVTQERLAESMAMANYHSETAGYADRRSIIKANATTWGSNRASANAIEGQSRSFELLAMTNGTRVVQRETDGFMPGDPDIADAITDITIDPLGIEDRTTWLVASNVSTRGYTMTAKRDSLDETRDGFVDPLIDGVDWVLTGGDEFAVQTRRNADEDEMWRIYLVDDVDNASVAAVVTKKEGDDEVLQGVCSAPGDSVTIRYTAGELIGENGETVACPELEAAFGNERNDIFYVGADRINGSYEFMADIEEEEFETRVNEEYEDDGLIGSVLDTLTCIVDPDVSCNPEVYDTSPSNNSPYLTKSIYDASMRITYRDDRIVFTRNKTIIPE